MKRIIVAVMLLVGCSPNTAQRQACYAGNEASAFRQAEAECFSRGLKWKDCPAHERIRAELVKAHAGCP